MATDRFRTALRGFRTALIVPGAQRLATDGHGNLLVVRRLMEEVWAAGDLNLLPELVAEDYVGHQAIGDHYGPRGVQIDIETYRRAIPDLTVKLDDLLAVGDKVVRRFTLQGTHAQPFLGTPASGTRITISGIAIDRLCLGKVCESWVQIDELT